MSNWAKSDFKPLLEDYTQGFWDSIPFKIANDRIISLGLTIPIDPKLIFTFCGDYLKA